MNRDIRSSVIVTLLVILSALCGAGENQLVAQQINPDLLPLQPESAHVGAIDIEFGQPPSSKWGGWLFAEGLNVYGPDGQPIAARIQFQAASNTVFSRQVDGVLHEPMNQLLAQKRLENVRDEYGPIRKGELIPQFGWLYHVENLNNNRGGGSNLSLTKVKAEKWPAGISLDPYAYAITDGGYLNLNVAFLGKPSVTAKYDRNKNTWRLKLSHEERQTDMQYKRREEELDAKTGQLVTVKTGTDVHRFKIVSIVIPDPKNNIPGWVELRKLWPKIIPYGIEQDIKLPGEK